MIKKLGLLTIFLLWHTNGFSENASIDNYCQDKIYLIQHPHQVLSCAEKVLSLTNSKPVYLKEYKTEQFTEYEYSFSSVSWPNGQISNDIITPTLWNHDIDIFIPKTSPNHDTAILYITGGINNPINHEKNNNIDTLLTQLIKQNIVITLKDIPNQYLNVNGSQLKEDGIVAFTWNRYIHNPELSYYPLHIPMAIATQQAMTLAQNILRQHHIEVQHFIIMGASKRGWTTWMTALSDNRVSAIIPIVMDALNMQQQIPHMYATYGQHWPIALIDYYNQHIPEFANPANSYYSNYLKLLQIEDPFTYFSETPYKDKLSTMLKYIVNSSGDDFFLPDGSQYYYENIPGDKLLFYTPNSSHSISYSSSAKQLSNSIAAFCQRVIHHGVLPIISWKKNNTNELIIHYSEKPEKMILWSAQNPLTRDFRYACGIQYKAMNLTFGNNTTTVKIEAPQKGWQAQFIELDFPDGLQTSTPIFITPDRFPNENQVMPQNGMCRIIAQT